MKPPFGEPYVDVSVLGVDRDPQRALEFPQLLRRQRGTSPNQTRRFIRPRHLPSALPIPARRDRHYDRFTASFVL